MSDPSERGRVPVALKKAVLDGTGYHVFKDSEGKWVMTLPRDASMSTTILMQSVLRSLTDL